MGNTYAILKIATIAGTVFSVIQAFTGTLALEDLLLALTVAIALVTAKHGVNSESTDLERDATAIKRFATRN